MPKKARPWIDKKKAVTFKLINRTQKDPLIVDEDAPRHVLQKIAPKSNKSGAIDFQKRFTLPPCVFPSEIEEEEGLLNRAVIPIGPQPDWDADIVAAMDEDFDYEDPNNIIDDDFVAQAGGVEENQGEEDDDENEEEDEDEDEDEDDFSSNFGSDDEDGHLFEEEETRSVFTNYSMSSSVLPRNEGLTKIDEQFEAMFEKEYGNDMDIGPLDYEEIEGDLDPNTCPMLKQLIKEGEVEKNFRVELNQDVIVNNLAPDEEEDKEDLEDIEIVQDGKNKTDRYDCESILSTYSNLYNHPKLICEERRTRNCIVDKNGRVIPSSFELTKKNLKLHNAFSGSFKDDDDKSVLSRSSRISELSYRPKNETLEEKKTRKRALREYRKERRIEKKANKLAFKLEADRHHKELLNLQNNLNGIKLF